VGGEAAIPGVNRVIKLSSNEGALGPSPAAIEAYRREATAIHRYPDGAAVALREAIAAAWRLDAARILCGAGSDDLLCLLAQAYGGPGTETIVTRHAFAMYPIYARYAGSKVVTVEERDLTADVDLILGAVSPRTSLVFLANPNNPTGTFLPWSEILRLRKGLPEHVLLVLDLAYAEYLDDPAVPEVIGLIEASPNTVMTRTFSKIYGLGGLRLGWAYGPRQIIDVLDRVRSPFNASRPAQAAAIAALGDHDHFQASRVHNRRLRAWLTEALESTGVAVRGSEGNFVLADFAAVGRSADAADRVLRSRGIIVRRLANYGLPGMLRITIGTEDEMEALAEATAQFMQQLDRAGSHG
ncbi:MAG: histidinol-phosphate transaminase, partial [Elioraea sp.]|nr:histidinol-phosphate transaminase [Elioraea sp.]